MKYLAAYLMLYLGGNEKPQAADVKKVLSSVGAEADDQEVERLITSMEGQVSTTSYILMVMMILFTFFVSLYPPCSPSPFQQDVEQLVQKGSKKLVSLGGAPAAGGAAAGGAGGATGGAGEAAAEEEEAEESSDAGAGGGLFDDSDSD